MRSLALAIAVLVASAGACTRAADEAPPAAAATAGPETASVDEVSRAIAAGRCRPVDANSELTRRHMGTLPGAVLLSDPEAFGAAELPADKRAALVFYCSNAECAASHGAAERAIAFGYRDVRVMSDGIAGWVRAGHRVDHI